MLLLTMAINASTVIRLNRLIRFVIFVRKRGMEGGLNAPDNSVANGFINIVINIFKPRTSSPVITKNYIFAPFAEKTKSVKY